MIPLIDDCDNVLTGWTKNGRLKWKLCPLEEAKVYQGAGFDLFIVVKSL